MYSESHAKTETVHCIWKLARARNSYSFFMYFFYSFTFSFFFRSRKVTLTNFCLGKHLMNNNDLLKDQRGSPAYISPDVLSGKPYAGKPSDMWALGVVLFTMLYGQFPFYDNAPHELFQSKIFFLNLSKLV